MTSLWVASPGSTSLNWRGYKMPRLMAKIEGRAMAPGLRRRAGALFETWHCCKISDDQRRSKESKLALSTWVRWASEGLSLGLACELVLGSSWSIGKTFWNLKKLKIADICFECFNIFDNLCPSRNTAWPREFPGGACHQTSTVWGLEPSTGWPLCCAKSAPDSAPKY